ncbi:malate--CoA ligase subunit beta [Candidatus Spongiihabitans sp.]|uniref:malate--CoA ligase subunit beta n=1 Tax=Candidatus Spongiihabitans sp. TaxID=3101308 RepID=UPI003C7CF90E
MEVHEYQAKQLLKEFGVPIPAGGLAYSPEQAVYRANEIGGEKWVVKAQIHSGARGKAGGIKFCSNTQDVWDAAEFLLGRKLVTDQTGAAGKIVYRLYIEPAADIKSELYFGLALDRSHECIVAVGSSQGGVDIEQVSSKNPESLIRINVELAVGMQPFQARQLAFQLGLEGPQVQQATNVFLSAYRAFRDLDATMLEINPLAITQADVVVALDAKMSFDDNALFRRSNISEYRDKSQEDPREMEAADRGLSYVGLDGNIGCIVNGAGLAMATMDIIKMKGGEPANFLDIGGGASAERVAKAFRLVLSDKKVEVILVNIFAGINRCDWVAEGVVQAVRKLKPEVPVVVRLSGTNAALGQEIINHSDLGMLVADTLDQAAEVAVNSVVNSMIGFRGKK